MNNNDNDIIKHYIESARCQIMDGIWKLNEKIDGFQKEMATMKSQIKDIDMDLNDIYDDVEGKHEDNYK